MSEPPGYRVLASGLKFPEGPVLMEDGSVLVVEIARGTLSRVTTSGDVEIVAECGGGPNGAAIGPDGAAYITNNGGCFTWIDIGSMLLPGHPPPPEWSGGSIQRVDLATGAVETVYTECDGRPLRAPNDLVFDAHGGFWFTDHGVRMERTVDRTGVYYAQPDGSSITEAIFPVDAPNGIGLSPSGDELYVAETHVGRIWAWPVEGPGQVGRPNFVVEHGGRLVAGVAGYQLFDSLAVHPDGRVCVATLSNGGITVATPDGASVEHIPLPDPLVTNICFGDGGATAYATLSAQGQLVAFDFA